LSAGASAPLRLETKGQVAACPDRTRAIPCKVPQSSCLTACPLRARSDSMTAVDQAGNRVARYRKSTTRDLPRERPPVEITVHPDRKLTDELVLAIAISADWLESYFHSMG
jgi:hypothetical protein